MIFEIGKCYKDKFLNGYLLVLTEVYTIRWGRVYICEKFCKFDKKEMVAIEPSELDLNRYEEFPLEKLYQTVIWKENVDDKQNYSCRF